MSRLQEKTKRNSEMNEDPILFQWRKFRNFKEIKFHQVRQLLELYRN